MLNYAVVEISGRQYKVTPKASFEVDFLGDEIKDLECDKVLALAEDDKLQVGSPYLKEKLKFEVIGKKTEKIRVAKYHAKANTRKVTGSKKQTSIIRLAA